MEVKEIIDQYESSLPLDKVRVSFKEKYFQVYPWVKSRVFHQLLTGNEVMQNKDSKILWLQVKSIFYGWRNIFRKYDIWVFSNSMERRELGGVYFDKLFDFLGNNNGLKTWIVEFRIFQTYPLKKIASKYASSKSIFLLLEEIYILLFLRKVAIENEDVLREFQNELGAEVGVQKIAKKYLAQYFVMKQVLKIFPNPKLLCLTVSYSNFGYIRAFKERGIKVVEFQHASISKQHYSYYYKTELDAIQFPDFIASIGDSEVEVFNDENKFPVHKIYPVGSFILNYYQEFKQGNPLGKINSIAVSLQDGDIGEELLPLIVQSAKTLKNIEFKLKRRRTSIEYYMSKYQFPSNVSFEEEKNIYHLISESDLHCTVYSSTAIEALSLGVPNILYDFEGYARIQKSQLIGNPFTYFVKDVMSFVSAVNSIVLPDREAVIQSNSKNVKMNYKENIKAFLKEIIHESDKK